MTVVSTCVWRVENVGQRIAHLHAQHGPSQLDSFKDEIGSKPHSHADQKFGDDQERPIGQGVGADSLPDCGKQ